MKKQGDAFVALQEKLKDVGILCKDHWKIRKGIKYICEGGFIYENQGETFQEIVLQAGRDFSLMPLLL